MIFVSIFCDLFSKIKTKQKDSKSLMIRGGTPQNEAYAGNQDLFFHFCGLLRTILCYYDGSY